MNTSSRTRSKRGIKEVSSKVSNPLLSICFKQTCNNAVSSDPGSWFCNKCIKQLEREVSVVRKKRKEK